MANLRELRDERLRKLAELTKLGHNAYPADSHRSHTTLDLTKDFGKLKGKVVTAAGRIINTRKFGKIAFFVLKDATGEIQLFLKHDHVEKADVDRGTLGFDQLGLLDPGDFIEVTGKLVKTKTGEISIEVTSVHLLTKSLRSLPTTQEGFSDKEQRLRRRYIDTNVNPEVYERFIRRSKFWQSTRDFLLGEGFVEINVPVLEHTTGGADANPFVTHMDALDEDFYLRISHELPLKRLIGGGYEKVFDIGPRFRNENYSDEHLPEHVAMEYYWAYADWRDGMKLTEALIKYVAKSTFGTLKFKVGGKSIDLGKSWPEQDFSAIMKSRYGLQVHDTNLTEVQSLLRKNRIETSKQDSLARGLDKLWKHIRNNMAGPVFVTGIPKIMSPLAKADPINPHLAERFWPILAGTEMGTGWSELNDPQEQLARFKEQQELREHGDPEAQMLDIDYVEMLEYGMPPTFGYGYSERLFWSLEGVSAREGVPFPQLRYEIDEVTKGTYPEVYSKKAKAVSEGSASGREQDFSKRIVAVVNKDLKPWQVANAVAHMTAIIGNRISHDQLVSGDVFSAPDGSIPRNSQYPIIIKRAGELELHKLHREVQENRLTHHVFIKEMQDTTDDSEIIQKLGKQPLGETTFYGVTFFGTNDQADSLTKKFQLWQ